MLAFDNSYSSLPDRFYARVKPTSVPEPRLIKYNHALAAELGGGLAELDEAIAAAIFAGNAVPEGANPISMAYAGHQFGAFVPQLGDGRAILLGEMVDRNGIRRDIQLKGAGRTPYSRGGDGRAAVGPVIREYLVSEAMHALGIPTTRSLAAVTTGDHVYRETALPGAVLTRVAASHIRVGTFQFFAARGDTDGLKALADYTIDRLYPELKGDASPYLALLSQVAARQALLVARWMHIGFIHGVMNTDNSSISGETIDYGPCAFMEAYDPATVFSSIDRAGRYAYQNQAGIAQWNLARLAETLLPLIDPDIDKAVEAANQVMIDFATLFRSHWLAGMRRKIGLTVEESDDEALVQSFLDLLQANEIDFTRGFRLLADAAEENNEIGFLALFVEPSGPAQWLARWRERTGREEISATDRAAAMRAVNPLYIPRNHLIEEAIKAAIETDNFTPFEALLDVLARPYEDRPDVPDRYKMPARPEEQVLRTFCGT
jgi:uncharacterized protein YdiU (UPF0061 family)